MGTSSSGGNNLNFPADLDQLDTFFLPRCPTHSTTASTCFFMALAMLPSRSRFLADLTLGFADGLTVPFALTAGLSSLGRTETIIYAGLAEICAGCISMGIGGYLSAKGEAREASDREKEACLALAATQSSISQDDRPTRLSPSSSEDESQDSLDVEKGLLGHQDTDNSTDLFGVTSSAEACAINEMVETYLDPLDLPSSLRPLVMQHILSSKAVLVALAQKELPATEPTFPIATGLSVALGYLLGGLIPLFPYIFVKTVMQGLLWSSIMCVIALFAFGFGKRASSQRKQGWVASAMWDGAQMAALGAIAAAAAVGCVKILDRKGV